MRCAEKRMVIWPERLKVSAGDCPRVAAGDVGLDGPAKRSGCLLAIETLRDDRREAQNSIPYVRLLLRLVN